LAKTVLVLGAGASRDFGFPLGEGLINVILDNNTKTHYLNSIRRILFNNKEKILRNDLRQFLPVDVAALFGGREHELLFHPPKSLVNWTELLTVPTSIDQFIYYRKDYSLIAKLNILLSLSQFERPETFGPTQTTNGYGTVTSVTTTWYRILVNYILDPSPSFDRFMETLSKIHFITFNYDRSLEFYLLKSIKAFFPTSSVKASDLPITHVYGKLGDLDEGDEDHLKYAPISYNSIVNRSFDDDPINFKVDARSFNAQPFLERDMEQFKLAESIQTYGSEYNQDNARKIQGILAGAENIYVFGFQFQRQNFNLLFGRELDDGRLFSHARFDATSFEMAEEKYLGLRVLVESMFPNRNSNVFQETRKSVKLLDYMRNNSIKLP
jgi:hypothetical protein